MTALESFTGGQPIAVDFTAIERELAGLWKSASSGTGEQGSPAVMRACQLNLMVLCRGAGEAERARQVVTAVARVRPSRVLLAVVDPDDPADHLEASIAALCSYAPGAGRGKQVCCEQITIAASGGATRRLPGAMLPLLLPDLPVLLWRPGDPDPAPEEKGDSLAGAGTRLIEAADRIVIDSRRLMDPAAGLGRLAALDRAITDLAWQQLSGWRDLIAGLFDGPAAQEHLTAIRTLSVGYTGPRGGGEARAAPVQALLLACWAASRLGWEPAPAAGGGAAGDAECFNLWCPDGESATVRLRPSGQDDPVRGQMMSVTLEAAGAAFSLRREAGADCVEARVTLPETCPLPVTARLVERDEATLLSRALETDGRDGVYDASLRLAARLLAVKSWGQAA